MFKICNSNLGCFMRRVSLLIWWLCSMWRLSVVLCYCSAWCEWKVRSVKLSFKLIPNEWRCVKLVWVWPYTLNLNTKTNSQESETESSDFNCEWSGFFTFRLMSDEFDESTLHSTLQYSCIQFNSTNFISKKHLQKKRS